jgi:imidazoleglycerol phosphate dehydratase HisB
MGGMHQSFSDITKSLTDVLKSLVSTKENTKVEQLGKALSQALNQKKQLQDMGMDTTALDNAIAVIQDKYTAALNDLENSA